jgi:hypothetical protein
MQLSGVPPVASTPRVSAGATAVVVPKVTVVAPKKGSTRGGTSVTVTGSGLTGVKSVLFGKVPASKVTVLSGTKVTAVSPAHAAGLVHVTVKTTVSSKATKADTFTFVVLPVVAAVAPGTGLPAGGTSVVLSGAGFVKVTTVKFGSKAASKFTVNSSSKITAVAPAAAAGAVDVRVTTSTGTSPVVPVDRYTYAVPLGPPMVTGLSPNAGPAAGGTSVTITGTNLVGASKVTFGGTQASSFTVVSSTLISAVTPAHTAGNAAVQVITPVGSSAPGAASTFAYTPAVPGVAHVSGELAANSTWSPSNASVYVIDSTVTVSEGQTLTLTPGTIVKFSANVGMAVLGTLNATGSTAQPVVLTSLRDDSAGGDTNGDGANSIPAPNDWTGVSASPGLPGQATGALSMDHVQTRYGGISASGLAAISATNSTFIHGTGLDAGAAGPITVTGNTVSDTRGPGYENGITVVQTGVGVVTRVSGNTVDGVPVGVSPGLGAGVSVTADTNNGVLAPTVMNNGVSHAGGLAVVVVAAHIVPAQITGNTGQANKVNVLGLAGHLSTDLTLPMAGLPVALVSASEQSRNLVVDDGVTLRVAGGTVVKALSFGWCYSCSDEGRASLEVDGSLVASGSATAPVVFTTIADDSVGGDTNSDGGATVPLPGDWSGIIVSGTQSNVHLTGTDIYYASFGLALSGGAHGSAQGAFLHDTIGIWESDTATIDASGSDWGDPSGPAPLGTGTPIQGNGITVAPWVGETASPPPVAPPQQGTPNPSYCRSYVMFIARGSGEAPQGNDALDASKYPLAAYGGNGREGLEVAAAMQAQLYSHGTEGTQVRSLPVVYPSSPVSTLATHMFSFGTKTVLGVKVYNSVDVSYTGLGGWCEWTLACGDG